MPSVSVWSIDEVVVSGKTTDPLKSVHCAKCTITLQVLQYFTVLNTNTASKRIHKEYTINTQISYSILFYSILFYADEDKTQYYMFTNLLIRAYEWKDC